MGVNCASNVRGVCPHLNGEGGFGDEISRPGAGDTGADDTAGYRIEQRLGNSGGFVG